MKASREIWSETMDPVHSIKDVTSRTIPVETVLGVVNLRRADIQGKTLVILVDSDDLLGVDAQVDVAAVSVLDCRDKSLDEFLRIDFQNHVFVYACIFDDVGLPFVKAIKDHRGVFFSSVHAAPTSYYHQNGKVRDCLLEEWDHQSSEKFAKFDWGSGDFVNLCQTVDMARQVPGAYVEVGCFNGSSGCVALNYMRRTAQKRPCYFFDVFSGFDYDAARESADQIWYNTHMSDGRDVVERRLKRYESADGLAVHVQKLNILTDPLPKDLKRIAIANIDCDLYEPVLHSLNVLAPKIAADGIIVIEDPGHTPYLIGARLALSEFLDNQEGRLWRPIYMQSGQTLLMRNLTRIQIRMRLQEKLEELVKRSF